MGASPCVCVVVLSITFFQRILWAIRGGDWTDANSVGEVKNKPPIPVLSAVGVGVRAGGCDLHRSDDPDLIALRAPSSQHR